MAPSKIVRLPLLHDPIGPAWGKWAISVGLDTSLVESAKLKYRDSTVLITAAIDGQGAAQARRFLVKDDLEAGRVARLDTASLSSERALYFVCRAGDEDRILIRSLRNWLFSWRDERN